MVAANVTDAEKEILQEAEDMRVVLSDALLEFVGEGEIDGIDLTSMATRSTGGQYLLVH